jgi:aconitate hydratase
MSMQHVVRTFGYGKGKQAGYYSLPALEEAGIARVSRLPVSLRIVLESVLRNCDGKKVTEEDVTTLARWNAKRPAEEEIPFVVARIVLQDFTGVPLLVDLAAMRGAVAHLGQDPQIIEPLVPVDLVVDHSVQVDFAGIPEAIELNLEYEFKRNRERYEFLKWGQQAFKTFGVVPPGIGIVHQVNLEYLAHGVLSASSPEGELCYPDTLVGTDSHTTMINGLGIVGWGVGGIEAEAGMLGQPVYFLIGNMAPEYGATMGFFPVDSESVDYLRMTGRSEETVDRFEKYFRAQQLFGMPRKGTIDYSVDLDLDLASVRPSVAGPKRPQDRVDLEALGRIFHSLLSKPAAEGGYGKDPQSLTEKVTVSMNGKDPAANPEKSGPIGHGSVLIAAITSCTNTSNPSVMLGAGLLAKKAVERGMKVNPTVKTSLAPGSRVVTDYLQKTGLQPYLDQLGFNIVGYGCTTCIGNSGPLHPNIEQALSDKDFVAASVLSGNRNFEARVHQSIKANFLMSPPLVVAFALAGRVDVDLAHEPIGQDQNGRDVYLRDIWPTLQEIRDTMETALSPEVFRKLYADFASQNPKWNEISSSTGELYQWDEESNYIHEPPFFAGFSMEPGRIEDIIDARPLGIFGDSVTTDHISPAGAIKQSSPAGQYLISRGVQPIDFNSYGSRRGNDLVMTRGTFANVRIKNLMVPGVEGGVTKHYPSGDQLSIFEAAVRYQEQGVPLIVIAGHEYGTGSSRDWAAKGTRLLGVKVVIAESFERIHRSNLVGMGVLPLQFPEGTNARSLKLGGSETFSVTGLSDEIRPRQKLRFGIKRADGQTEEIVAMLRIDTPIEVDYYRHGGILPYVLRELLGRAG